MDNNNQNLTPNNDNPYTRNTYNNPNSYHIDNSNNNQNEIEKAEISMVCGIISIMAGLIACCCCLGFVGVPFAIGAIVLAFMSKNETGGVMNSSAKVGLITGIIGLGISVIAVVIYFAWGFMMGLGGVI